MYFHLSILCFFSQRRRKYPRAPLLLYFLFDFEQKHVFLRMNHFLAGPITITWLTAYNMLLFISGIICSNFWKKGTVGLLNTQYSLVA